MKAISAVVVALFATACAPLPGGFGPSGAHTTDSYMTGRMSSVRGFDDDLTVDRAELAGSNLAIEMHVEGRYGWAMIGGDINLGDYEIGESVELTEEDVWNFVGCSGPEAYNFEFDEAPDSVTITLVESDIDGTPGVDAPDTVDVIIDADFGADGSITAVTQVVVLR